MVEFGMESIPQISWWKQRDYSKSIKPMDKLPLIEIQKLYESGFVLCDSCGKKIKISDCKYSLVDHITHLINTHVVWTCEGCYLQEKREGKIIVVIPNTDHS